MKDTKAIAEALKQYPQTQVNNYIAYLDRLQKDKNKDGSLKNPWMQHKDDEYLIRIFRTVADDGLVFDGDDITLQNTGVSYSYQAYKKKMFIAYPESLVDVGIVYEGDSFNFAKTSGQVNYNHTISNPFGHEDKDIRGAYCVIKNNRGQFLTTLSPKEIQKHRSVAKTDYIWKQWFPEMVLKTVIKKGCKQHFKDAYQEIERLDNENYDLEQLPKTEGEKVITIGDDNLNWLVKFCVDHKITKEEDKKAMKDHYKFDPYKTTPEDFKTIKKTILVDYNEEEPDVLL